MIRRFAEAPPRTHAIRLIVAWVVLSIIGMIIASQLPIPPGPMSEQGQGQTSTLVLLTILSWPVMVGVTITLLYFGIVMRVPRAELRDGEPDFGNLRLQVGWVAISTVIVLFLALVGIVTLSNEGLAKGLGVPGRAINGNGQGAGSQTETVGQVTGGQPLEVQVIGQQWFFTYRFPQYGGVETTHIELPVGVPIEFHVTSLDVIHSWWAYQLGVKADANPGVDNEANITPKHTGSFTIRCSELCGIWHGAMFDTGQVVSSTDFDTWIHNQESQNQDVTKLLPSYAPTYFPAPAVRGG